MTKTDALALMKEIGKLGYRPNPLESQFLQGMAAKMENKNHPPPSTKQGNYLELIYRRASHGGQYEPSRKI